MDADYKGMVGDRKNRGEAPRRALLLDIMDTVVVDPFFHGGIEDFFGLSLSELYAAIRPGLWVAFEHGEVDEDEYYRRFFADGRGVDGAALLQWMRDGYRIVDGMVELMSELRAEGIPMYALSNYPVWWREIEATLTLSRWLQWRFVSCMTGVRKPDPRSYTGAADALGLQTSACFFVDDRRSNVDAAVDTGMQGAVFSDAASLRQALVEAGYLPTANRKNIEIGATTP